MKFNNGCWLEKEHTECFFSKQAYFTKVETDKVTICAPTGYIANRGCTLGGINLTLIISSPMEEVIRVQTYHHLGSVVNEPSFDLDIDNVPLDVDENEERIIIKSGNLALEIGKKEWYMRYTRAGKLLTESYGKDMALIKTDWSGFAYDKGDEENTYMRQQLAVGVGELFYGMGERFTPFVKNGQSVSIWNEDGGTSTEQSYKNIPFYISNKGYGVFVNHPEKVEFEMCTEMVTRAGFSVEGTYLDYFLIDGPDIKGVLSKYTDMTGKPGLPAPWTFGLWLSTSFTTNYDEETVMSMIDKMLECEIPLRTFHFDCFWMKEFHWSDFTWDSRVFSDPVGMLKRIKDKGLNICVWINPYIAQESSLFKEGMDKGYFLKRPNGKVWQWDMWQPGMAIVDFTNPQAYSWYQDKLEVLLDMGVDCFKTDFGERIPTEVVYSDGSDAKKMHNLYSYLYNKCVFELLERKRGEGETVLFSRSATVGGQKFPVHWGGDCWSDYESMEESLRGGLSLCMSGFGFWAHDIGGFENTSTADVYKRWVAFGLLSSHSRLHGSSSYRVPWNYDEEAVDVVRHFTRLKAKLMPYIYKTAVNASKTGVPCMRSMVMEFTNDRNCHYLDRQYMFGDNLLVAPIFNEEGRAEYYLPQGIWTNFLTGKEYSGGRWIEEHHDYMSIPLMVRENSVIVVGDCDSRPDYDYAQNCEIRIYALHDGIKIDTDVYGMDNNVELSVDVRRKGRKIRVDVDASRHYKVRMINMHAKEAVNGFVVIEGNDSVITPDAGACTLEIMF